MLNESILLKLGFDARAVSRGLKATQAQTQRASQHIAGQFKKAFSFFAAPMTIAGFGGFFQSLRDLADDITTKSAALGVTTDFFQDLKVLGEQSGIGIDKVTGAFERLTRRMGLARQGSVGYAKAFKDLGIDLAAGRTAQEVWYEVADALSKVKNKTDQAAFAFKLFSFQGTDMLAVMKDGAEGLKAYGHELDKFTDQQLRNIDKADKGLKKFSLQAKVYLGGLLADVMAPHGTDGMPGGWLANIAPGGFMRGRKLNDLMSRGAALDAKRAALDADKASKAAQKEAEETRKRALFEEYIAGLKKKAVEYAELQRKIEKARIDYQQKYASQSRAVANARGNIRDAWRGAQTWTLQELAEQDPDTLDDAQYAQWLKANQILEMEEKGRRLNVGAPGKGTPLFREALAMRRGMKGIAQEDITPYGDMFKNLQEQTDALKALVAQEQTQGLRMMAKNGP